MPSPTRSRRGRNISRATSYTHPANGCAKRPLKRMRLGGRRRECWEASVRKRKLVSVPEHSWRQAGDFFEFALSQTRRRRLILEELCRDAPQGRTSQRGGG